MSDTVPTMEQVRELIADAASEIVCDADTEWNSFRRDAKHKLIAALTHYAALRAALDEQGRICPMPKTFEQELRRTINRYSQENGSNTPDFLLAEYLIAVLSAWNTSVMAREKWYGREAKPNVIQIQEGA